MLLELHINIPGCNEVSYWTRSGLIVWLNNLKMLLKGLHFSSAFQRECFTLGHSINQTHRGFAGPCSFHHLFRHAVIGWNKKQRGSKVFTSGCFSSFPSQLEMRPVFSCCGQVFAMPGPTLWGSSWLHLHQVCAAFQQLFFYCASSSSSIFSQALRGQSCGPGAHQEQHPALWNLMDLSWLHLTALQPLWAQGEGDTELRGQSWDVSEILGDRGWLNSALLDPWT